MEQLDLEKILKNIEVYKYMLWSSTKLDQNEVGVSIQHNLNKEKTDFFEYIISINLDTWCDSNLEDVTITLDRIRKLIENFIREYQLDSKGKIIRSASKKFIFMGPLLSQLNFEFTNEKLTAFFEYDIQTIEEK